MTNIICEVRGYSQLFCHNCLILFFLNEANLIFEDVAAEVNKHLNLIDNILRTEKLVKFPLKSFLHVTSKRHRASGACIPS